MNACNNHNFYNPLFLHIPYNFRNNITQQKTEGVDDDGKDQCLFAQYYWKKKDNNITFETQFSKHSCLFQSTGNGVF